MMQYNKFAHTHTPSTCHGHAPSCANQFFCSEEYSEKNVTFWTLEDLRISRGTANIPKLLNAPNKFHYVD